jgi:hypothetical protein
MSALAPSPIEVAAGAEPRRSWTPPVPLLLFAATFSIYLLSYGGEGRPFDYFARLADAFLHGRVYLTESPSWLAELIPIGGRYYVVFPPMPAFVLMPFVALFGTEHAQTAVSILLGAANVALCYAVIRRFFGSTTVALWTAVLYSVGTVHWYHAETANAWYFAQICANFFLWLALLEAAGRRRLLVIGLCLSGAFLSRVTTLGAAAFSLVLFWDRFVDVLPDQKRFHARLFIKPALHFAIGLLAGFLVAAWYNEARFGSPREFGYALIPGVLQEPWYNHGLVSIRYVPTHLDEMLTALPMFQRDWPFAVPRVYVMAFWVTTPAWLLIVFADFRSRLAVGSLAAIGLILIPILTHGGPGFTQFGNRFSIDYMPFLLLLTASGMRGRVTWWMQALIALSILINLWGVIMISRLGWWVF